jgi:hypothetical protein
MNLIRVTQVKQHNVPVATATCYKWHHTNKYPGLFTKIGGLLLMDLDHFEEIVERNRKPAMAAIR